MAKIEKTVEKRTPIKKAKKIEIPKKNPVTGKYDNKLSTMKLRAKLAASSNKERNKAGKQYKGDNPAGIKVSVSSKGTYKDPSGAITHTDSSTRYGKEKLDKGGKEYQEFKGRSKVKHNKWGRTVKGSSKSSGRQYTGRKAKKREKEVSGTHLYGDWLND